MKGLNLLQDSMLHLFFPHLCAGCGSDKLGSETELCLRCLQELPRTYFEQEPANPIEKICWGRFPVQQATALYYFSRNSIIQQLMQQLKYKGNQSLGLYLGRMMGNHLMDSNWLISVDALVPLPLFRGREKQRGYNQANLLCNGIAEQTGTEVWENVVIRNHATSSQTKKNRLERWKNMQGLFSVSNPSKLEKKHVVLVDDVITTGATLEACATALLGVEGLRLSIATLCYSSL